MRFEELNKFRNVVVNHHTSFDALIKSVRGGCHLCGLMLMAWEENCRFVQEPGGGWLGKAKYDSASLNDGITLQFQRVATKIPQTDVVFGELQVVILCGELGEFGRLICEFPMDSERSSTLVHH